MEPLQRALQFCADARQLLAQAQQEAYANPATLKLAEHYFEAALEQVGTHLDAQLGLAYIAALCDQPERAQRALRAAEGLDPQNAKVLQLKQELERHLLGHESPPSLCNPSLALNQISVAEKRRPQMPQLDAQFKDRLGFLKRNP